MARLGLDQVVHYLMYLFGIGLSLKRVYMTGYLSLAFKVRYNVCTFIGEIFDILLSISSKSVFTMEIYTTGHGVLSLSIANKFRALAFT